jgi:hypothetical protein
VVVVVAELVVVEVTWLVVGVAVVVDVSVVVVVLVPCWADARLASTAPARAMTDRYPTTAFAIFIGMAVGC